MASGENSANVPPHSDIVEPEVNLPRDIPDPSDVLT